MPQWSNAVRVAVANTTSSMVDNVLLRTGYEVWHTDTHALWLLCCGASLNKTLCVGSYLQTMDGRLVADFRIITANDNQDSVRHTQN